MSTISFCVGIDLGNDKHAVCVLDPLRQVIKSCVVENDQRLLDAIGEAIGDASPASVHIGLEDRNNVVVDALLAGGFAVFTANPKQVDRFRERETVAGAKDDRRDARVLANALATDEALFHRVALQSEAEVAMSSLTATLVELDDEHRRLSNQLRAVVLRFFPALLALCQGADQAWFWALLLRLGDADAAASVRKATIAALLKAHRKRTVTADDVVAVIKARHLPTAPGVKEAHRQHSASLIARLAVVDRQRATTTRARDALLAELEKPKPDGSVSDVAILRSMPGVGPKTVAVLFSECLPLLVAGSLERLRGISGVAPVTKQSGKGRRVTMRHACNARVRGALFHVATTASRQEGQFKTKYTALIKKGHGHARALRSVSDAQLHVLVAMFKKRTTYKDRTVIA
jgi:transposase